MIDDLPVSAKTLLLAALGVITIAYVLYWGAAIRRERLKESASLGGDAIIRTSLWPDPIRLAIGFIADFFDTLGVSSFATTTALFKFANVVPDRVIPGTLNVGHMLPTAVQAFLYMELVKVDPWTLVLLIFSSVAGSWLGAGVVASWSKRKVQIGMGVALICAAVLMLMRQFELFPGGGDALGISGMTLLAGVVGNFVLGALMTLGIGLYAPCMIMVSLLGMNPKAAFPIMMGSCAFLMPTCSVRFIQEKSYDPRAALGLALGGIPAVFLATYLVQSLPLGMVRWLVVVVVIYTAILLLRSAFTDTKSLTEPIPGRE